LRRFYAGKFKGLLKVEDKQLNKVYCMQRRFLKFGLLFTSCLLLILVSNKVLAAPCAEGPITGSCECGTETYTVGYCCQTKIWFDQGYPGCPTGNYYWVEQNNVAADDSNPGTEDQPWKTFDKGLATAVAGDVVLVKEGTYIDPDPSWAQAFTPAHSGTDGSPIIFKSYPQYAAVLKRLSRGMPAMKIVSREYITMDGFKAEGVLGCRENAHHCVIKNNDVSVGGPEGSDETLVWGITIMFSEFCLVENNYVHDIEPPLLDTPSHNAAGIMIFACSDNIVQHNYVDAYNYADAKLGVYNDYGQKGGSIFRNVWRYNIGVNGKAGFIGMGSTDSSAYSIGNYIYQNIIINAERGFEFDHNAQEHYVYNNVFYNVDNFIVDGGSENIKEYVWNNIVDSNSYCYYTGNETNPLNLFDYLDYNDLVCNGIASFNWGHIVSSTISDWRSATGFENNSITSDPIFLDPDNADITKRNYKLGTGSLALLAGIDRQDYDGDANATEKINMGAYITGNEIIGPDKDGFVPGDDPFIPPPDDGDYHGDDDNPNLSVIGGCSIGSTRNHACGYFLVSMFALILVGTLFILRRKLTN
jgi:hypothetical protein